MQLYKAQMEYGHLILVPLTYRVRRLPNGQGEIVSDYGTVTGKYADLIENIGLLNGTVEFEDASQGK